MAAKNYTGNKDIPGLIHKIVNHVPKHSNYWELFAGSGAVGSHLTARWTIQHYNDIDPYVLNGILSRYPTASTHSFDYSIILRLLQRDTKETFIFCDPPYMFETRYSNSYYKFELSDIQHQEFLTAVKLLKCNCMIIHPQCKMYDHELQSWNSLSVKVRYNRKTSIEKIYMNYDSPGSLQTYKFIGKDCWQRQGYKRKAERFLKQGPAIDFPEPTYIQDFFPPVQ